MTLHSYLALTVDLGGRIECSKIEDGEEGELWELKFQDIPMSLISRGEVLGHAAESAKMDLAQQLICLAFVEDPTTLSQGARDIRTAVLVQIKKQLRKQQDDVAKAFREYKEKRWASNQKTSGEKAHQESTEKDTPESKGKTSRWRFLKLFRST